MLPIALVNEINRMLQEGSLSHREIAVHLGISRGTISAIASGRRGLHGRESRKTHSPLIPTSPPRRCPECGYRVYLPCRICRTRQLQERKVAARILLRTGRTDNPVRRSSAHLSTLTDKIVRPTAEEENHFRAS